MGPVGRSQSPGQPVGELEGRDQGRQSKFKSKPRPC